MGYPASSGGCGLTRRGFLAGAASGLALGVPATYLALRGFDGLPRFSGKSVEVKKPQFAMPGPFPGRVIEVHDPASVTDDNRIQASSVKQMMDRGMVELTGADHSVEAWKRFFERGDVVGIKVNPVGRKRKASEAGSISSPEVLLEVVAGLKSAGVRPQDIIVFERYAQEFRDAGYDKVMTERAMDGVRWYASAADYDGEQLDIDGYPKKVRSKGRDPHVAGYDPDVFVHMGFTKSDDRRDDRRFRSHLSVIVTQMVNKIITLPVLKDHRSAGVTLALKNISHGMNNNVARSHLETYRRRSDRASGPNQCNTFIPTAAGQQPLREKSTLHIMDGLIGVYEGGPGSWNATWGTWRRKSLFFATDPVAMDHVGWDIIDHKRAAEGWLPVARMGSLEITPDVQLSTGLAALAGSHPLDAMALAGAADNRKRSWGSEAFDRRQPEHVILAGTIGMGVFDARRIDYRKINIKA